jgi:anti-sigma factor RsiW
MTMEHAEALERIEIAAVEPDGLERLMAGDTPEAAAVAGHLAGCAACTAELALVGRTSALAREAIRALPDPELRERTLSFVRAVGRDRAPGPSLAGAARVAPALAALNPDLAPDLALPKPAVVEGSQPATLGVNRAGRRRFANFSALAAAVVIAGVFGFAAAGVVRAPVIDHYGTEVSVLSAVAETTVRIEQRADATHVVLAAPDGGAGVTGTLLYSPSGGELVMVAQGLAAAPDGQEYGCWVEVAGQKRRIGRMYMGGNVQAWAGPVAGLADLPPGAVFGVSLVPVGGGAGETILTGRL